MVFGYPYMLLLLLVALGLAIFYLRAHRRNRKARELLARPESLAAMGLGKSGKGGVIAASLITGAAALAAIALARPLGPPAGGGFRTAGMDVVVALDISDSMAVQDAPGGRLSAAKDYIRRLVSARPDNRYGLVLFSGDAVVSCPLTIDRGAFIEFLSDADFPREGLPGTNIAEGIRAAAERFKKSGLPRAVVVVTDGENTYGPDPAAAAGAARDDGFKVYTVGVGTAEGGRIPSGADFFGSVQYKRDREGRIVVSRLDKDALRKAAEAGGGRYFDASDSGSVGALADELTVRGAKRVKDPFKDAREYGPYLAFAGFCLATMAIAL